MKKIAFLLMSLLLITSCYDDSALQEQYRDLESRVDSLETLCAKLNTNYTSLQTIVDALESEDHVTAMAPVMEGNQIVGYTLTFKKSGPVTIYCETAPDVKVDGDSWLASYDGGQKWQRVGATVMSSGDLYIKSIKLDGQYVYLTLSDGKTQVKVPIGHIPPVMTPVAGYCKAVFAGVANPVSVDYAVGVVVGDSKDAVKELIAGGEMPGCSTKEFAKDGAFEIVADCCPDVTNYYVVYTYSNGVFTWSDFATFETNKAEMTAAVKSISGASAVIEGKVTLKSAAEIRVEIESFGDAEDSGHRDYVTTPVTMGKNGSFTVTLKNLQFNMPYGYYVVVNYGSEETGDRQWSERYEFTTEANDAEITCEISEISGITAKISGKVLLMHEAERATVVVEYTRNYDEDYFWSYKTVPVKLDKFGNYSAELTGLASSSNYAVRARVYYADEYDGDENAYKFSNIVEFTTEENQIISSFEVSDLTAYSAKISGNIQFKYPISEWSEIRFQYIKANEIYDSDDWWNRDGDFRIELDSEGNFECILENLAVQTEYAYRIIVQDADLQTEVGKFTTLSPYDQVFDLNESAAVDLSASEPANCYVVSAGGLYKFRAVKGNDISLNLSGAVSASILWESFGTTEEINHFELIGGVCYKNGYVVFQTADVFREGNALIAVKDSDGNILWSWHIWMTDQPQGQTYYTYVYDEANSTWDNDVYYFTDEVVGVMMDRNLGAITASAYEPGIGGLLYQWGRKDPFIGCGTFGEWSKSAAATTTYDSSVSSDRLTGNIDYAVANPTTFITYNTGNHDWLYPDIAGETDNTRWQPEKTIYDPCPAGWHVPGGGYEGIWEKAGINRVTISFDSSTMCATFCHKDSDIVYPASGSRSCYSGGLDDVGYSGNYWSASPDSVNACYLYFYNGGYVYPSYCNYRAYGYSVRCLQE